MATNGKDPLDKINDSLKLLLASSEKNWEEHERIWEAVNTLRVNVLEMTAAMAGMTSAIRALIDRIPPEILKPEKPAE